MTIPSLILIHLLSKLLCASVGSIIAIQETAKMGHKTDPEKIIQNSWLIDIKIRTEIQINRVGTVNKICEMQPILEYFTHVGRGTRFVKN